MTPGVHCLVQPCLSWWSTWAAT